jgi:murein DD-endopeptidase MepM/ murein hydrolase activator NlpD
MKPPFNILLVYGDGSRVRRFCVPRWLAYPVVGVLAGVAVGIAGLSGEYLWLKHQGRLMAGLYRAADEQRELAKSFQARIASLRREIAGWQGLHATMWESFGPEAASNQTPVGIGGGTPSAVALAPRAGRDLGDELHLLATSVADEDRRLRDLERVVSRTGKLMSSLPLRWPIRGKVNSEFGLRRSPWSGVKEHHGGLDIGSPSGAPVKAPADGTVVAAGVRGDYGKHVTLDHGNRVRSLYGHLRKIDVKVGQRVEKGDVLGQVGSTGRSTGPHLHYEVHVAGKPVDPRGFLWDQTPRRDALASQSPLR